MDCFIKFTTLILLICCGIFKVSNAQSFEFNATSKRAYEAFVALKIKEGQQILAVEKSSNVKNLIPVFLENYDDFLTLMFTGDAKEFQLRKPNQGKRINLLDKGNSNSPWYRYSKACVHFQWALVKLRFDEYVGAATDFRKSYNLLKENSKKFPDFRYNNILLGLEEAIIGTIPDQYKWLTNMLGMKGDVKKGTQKIVAFLNNRNDHNQYLREEAIAYYCYLKFFMLADREDVWKYLDSSNLDYKNNHLFAFLKASLALSDNKAQLAAQILQNRNKSQNFLQIPLFDYYLGVAQLRGLDPQSVKSFNLFLQKNKGKVFVKDAYQKLSWYYITVDNSAAAQLNKEKIVKVSGQQIDADKQAQRFAQSSDMPNSELLKVRLLTDGGYVSKANDIMGEIDYMALINVADQLEYNYRMAHILVLQRQAESAIPYYEKTIQIGKSRKEHFASRSALELGEIYEDMGNSKKAADMFRTCINMTGHDFESSLEQKAKAGLDRLGVAF